jgi:hypothetical protein
LFETTASLKTGYGPRQSVCSENRFRNASLRRLKAPAVFRLDGHKPSLQAALHMRGNKLPGEAVEREARLQLVADGDEAPVARFA